MFATEISKMINSQQIYFLSHQTKNLHLENKFLSHKQYLFSLLASKNVKKTSTNQSIPHVLLLCLKRIYPQTLKVASAKTLFFSVYVIGQTCYDDWFLFHVIIARHCFPKSLSLLWDSFNHHVVAFFEASILKEVCILCVIFIKTVRYKYQGSKIQLIMLFKFS